MIIGSIFKNRQGVNLKMGFEKILQPGKIGNMELRNRLIMPAMGTNLAAADGTVSDVIVNYYARRANGGVGLIITEVVSPDPSKLHSRRTRNLVQRLHARFEPDSSCRPLRRSKVCLQLAHAGCFASHHVTGQQPVSLQEWAPINCPTIHPEK